jgi:hypothetical protein
MKRASVLRAKKGAHRAPIALALRSCTLMSKLNCDTCFLKTIEMKVSSIFRKPSTTMSLTNLRGEFLTHLTPVEMAG